RLVTVKRARGGVIEREVLDGEEIKTPTQFYVKGGDFLISKRQIVHGACGLVPDNLDGSIVSNEYAILGTDGRLDLKFLRYLSETIYFQQTCFHSSIGVHIEKMIFKVDRWLKWDFNIPPLSEQIRIARILSTWDRAIEIVERLIANSKAQKKALMQQLLTGKRRFPGDEGEWGLGCFGEGIRLISGQHIEASNVNSDRKGVPYLTGPADFPNGYLVISKYTDTPKVLCDDGDILITVKGSGTGKSILSNSTYCISRQLMAVRATSFDRIFAFYVLQSRVGIFEDAASGLIPGISRDDVLSFRVIIPPKASQKLIGRVLSACDQETVKLEQQVDALRRQKKALMQQLLTGKRRVKVDEEAA
ncbi:restriction endonuclease subunit S, partial [Candidatus Magnetaquicoccus inordinatus]|uniref:restriction endonuclease subunit S n=1 Tax=Candidatus Magnetaquicoccus inordinatus TaxID=2496818 RepID=UPI00102C3A45